MRVAPSIQIDIASHRGWIGVQRALYGLAVAVIVGWALASAGTGGGMLAAAAAGLATAWLAGRWLRSPPARLGWDGARWSLQQAGGPALPGRAEVQIDLGIWMLLRFRPEGAGARADRWLALGHRHAGAAWHGARVALFATPPLGARAAVAGGARPTA